MKKVLVVSLLFFGSWVYAEFSASNYGPFVQRLSNLALQMQDTRDECKRIVSVWNTEGISADPDFVAYPVGCTEGTDCELTTGELTALISACQDLELFWENQAVTTNNRQIWLAPFLNSSLR